MPIVRNSKLRQNFDEGMGGTRDHLKILSQVKCQIFDNWTIGTKLSNEKLSNDEIFFENEFFPFNDQTSPDWTTIKSIKCSELRSIHVYWTKLTSIKEQILKDLVFVPRFVDKNVTSRDQSNEFDEFHCKRFSVNVF